ncbi:hypothetical protein glysoja_047707 [Glycine soja]|uniref:Pentatricopeptide repeat-containing protein n=1 Tax=Glycine soja TaxID=3848 RepID=A0A0B2PJF7_GLYSO|nr:hypothetical protein glysoja_047707 [Glycine soja]
MLNEAIELYSSMRKDDFITSTHSVNRLLRTLAIQAAVMLKDLDKGFEFMKSMEKDGMGPSVFAYNLLLS